jgi:hypothetical protein
VPTLCHGFGLLKTKINDMHRGLYNGIKHGAGDNMCAQKDHGISNGEGGAEGRMTPKNKGLHNFVLKTYKKLKGNLIFGAPGRIRTCGLRIRSPLLYPAELQALE